jgi:ketosteroid isomerase-like protein
MKKVILLITFCCSFLMQSQNVAKVDKFFELVFTNPDAANDLLHDDFTFKFMGVCEICKTYNKKTYVSEWIKKDIPAVLPNGIRLETIRKIDGGDDVVFLVKGHDAVGVNGDYNNNYAMVFQFKDGLIFDFKEYHSDLLAETKLHKKKIVDVE